MDAKQRTDWKKTRNIGRLDSLPDQKFVPGDSVDEHRNIENGNIILTGDEIRQQNENL